MLHFERRDRPHSSYDSLSRQLRRYLADHDKGTFRAFDVLWAEGRIEQAIGNARRLRASRTDDPGRTAYTDVDLVIDALRSVAASAT